MSITDEWDLVYEHGTGDFGDGGDIAFAATEGQLVAIRVTGTTTLEVMSASDPEGPWTYGSFDVGGNDFANGRLLLSYGAGTWVAAVLTGYTTGDGKGPYHTAILTSTDPSSSWTRQADIVQAGSYPSGVGPPSCLGYYDGTWVLGVKGGRIVTATDPTGAWTLAFNMGTLTPTDYSYFIVERSTAGWIATATTQSGPVGSHTVYVWASNSLSSGWTEQTTFYVPAFDQALRIGTYDDGYYILTYRAIYTAAAADGPWSVILDLADLGTGWSATGEFNLTYADGDYILWLGQKMATAINLAGPWVAGTLLGLYRPMEGLVYVDDAWVAISHALIDYPYPFLVFQSDALGGDGWGVLLS